MSVTSHSRTAAYVWTLALSVTVLAISAAATARAASPAAGRTLGGLTSQHWPVVAEVSKNTKQISVQVALDMNCTSGNGFTLPDTWTKLPVRSNGAVRAMITVPPVPPSSLSGSSITGGSDAMSGKFNRSAATFRGVWELHLNVSYSNGQTDSCDSGRVGFSTRL